jgi:hypothetical protein
LSIDKLMELKPLQTKIISDAFLKSIDPNGPASQIEYKVVKLPEHGLLTLNGTNLKVGDVYSQSDIDNGRLSFKSTKPSFPLNDGFQYIVSDSEGGWFGVNTFKILINDVTSSYDLDAASAINLFPNPTSSVINIVRGSDAQFYDDVKIFNSLGQQVRAITLEDLNSSIDVSQLNSGVFIMSFSNRKSTISKRMVISK